MNIVSNTENTSLKKWSKDCKRFANKLIEASVDKSDIVTIVGETSTSKEKYSGIVLKKC